MFTCSPSETQTVPRKCAPSGELTIYSSLAIQLNLMRELLTVTYSALHQMDLATNLDEEATAHLKWRMLMLGMCQLVPLG